ncbi:FKBP-type peptidyl-prolyl cis-trans isomerase [Blastococcus colisei]|uniref:Peptidyl-prolyl cis-trans isomerase n=1 Tax=Blastococcus colisei TaxID=1564162 RepID=A0A543P0C1_9ACTN|nr:FKBP-type peptidyl-prolyl cis-trans isomerase [Blastococcus colisei]TQN37420.1 FKBP-type peptidyl-prolyl cis-trans isomerase [Blastococcus colisei]
MIRRTAARAVLAAAVTVSLVACGDDGRQDEAARSAPETSTTEESTTTEASAAACETRPSTAEPAAGISTDLGVAPEVPPSDAPPPCGLVVSDIVVGTGAEATEGSTVALKYVGAFYETGEEFDSSWSRGSDETLPVTVGEGRVIPGFEQAIAGMKVGGRRLVTIPSDLGYGERGQGPIPGGATLTFVLDLVEVSP